MPIYWLPIYWLSPLFVIAEEKAEKDGEQITDDKQYYIEVDHPGEYTIEWILLKGGDNLDDVKAKIHEKIDIPVDEMRIIFKGKTLYIGTVAELVESAGETETVRVKLTCMFTGGGIIYS